MIRFQNLESTCDFYGLMFSNIFLSQDVRNLYCAFPLPSPVRGNNCPLGVWWCEAHMQREVSFPTAAKKRIPVFAKMESYSIVVKQQQTQVLSSSACWPCWKDHRHQPFKCASLYILHCCWFNFLVCSVYERIQNRGGGSFTFALT